MTTIAFVTASYPHTRRASEEKGKKTHGRGQTPKLTMSQKSVNGEKVYQYYLDGRIEEIRGICGAISGGGWG
jgi:hypothetical protein